MIEHAIEMDGYGEPDELRWRVVTRKPLEADEVCIRTRFAAVNRADVEIRRGAWLIQRPDPFPYTPGLEVVGDVASVGSAVDTVRPGDRVITMMQRLGGIHGTRPGGYADHVRVVADAVATILDGVDLRSIAALGLAAVTAAEGLRRLDVGPGTRIVVHGASGGVGSAAVAMAAALDAEVIAVLPRPGKDDYVKELGAVAVVHLDRHTLVDTLGTRSVDAVLETTGERTFPDSTATLRRGGRLCLVGALTGAHLSLSAWDLIQDLTITGWSSENLTGPDLRGHIDRICRLVATGQLRSPECREYPLPDAAAAHRDMERGALTGRALLIPPQSP